MRAIALLLLLASCAGHQVRPCPQPCAGICVNGTCQQCVADADCDVGQRCVEAGCRAVP